MARRIRPVGPAGAVARRVRAGAAIVLAAAALVACGGSDGRVPAPPGVVGQLPDVDATRFLEGTTVLRLASWTGRGTPRAGEAGTTRWEYPVRVAEVLYAAPNAPVESTGEAVLVGFQTDLGRGSAGPPWNLPLPGTAYVVAGRAVADVGAVRVGDLVVKGVFDEDLDIVGDADASAQLRSFVRSEVGGDAGPEQTERFLVDWVRSLNEEGDLATGRSPLQRRWAAHQGGGRDPERNLEPDTADPAIAVRLRQVHLGIDASELALGDGTVAVFSTRGQLATVPDGSVGHRAAIWVLPHERLEVRLLTDAGTRSKRVATFDADALLERSASATVHLAGSAEDAQLVIDGEAPPEAPVDGAPTSTP